MNKIYVGVDPGASSLKGRGAAMAVLDQFGAHLWSMDIPSVEYRLGKTGIPRRQVDGGALKTYIKEVANRNQAEVVAAVEHPPMPSKQFGAPVTAMFGVFIAYGVIKGILDEVCYSVVPIFPVSWRSAYNLKAAKSGGKDASLRLARLMFPSVDLRFQHSHNIAEALLIAEYARLIDTHHQPRVATR